MSKIETGKNQGFYCTHLNWKLLRGFSRLIHDYFRFWIFVLLMYQLLSMESSKFLCTRKGSLKTTQRLHKYSFKTIFRLLQVNFNIASKWPKIYSIQLLNCWAWHQSAPACSLLILICLSKIQSMFDFHDINSGMKF